MCLLFVLQEVLNTEKYRNYLLALKKLNSYNKLDKN